MRYSLSLAAVSAARRMMKHLGRTGDSHIQQFFYLPAAVARLIADQTVLVAIHVALLKQPGCWTELVWLQSPWEQTQVASTDVSCAVAALVSVDVVEAVLMLTVLPLHSAVLLQPIRTQSCVCRVSRMRRWRRRSPAPKWTRIHDDVM